MDFVVDDDAPVSLVEDGEVGKRIAPLLPVGEDIVRCDGDGADLFDLPGVFADLVRLQIRLVQEFRFPLSRGGNVGGEDERLRLQAFERGDADDGLARAAGKHHHPAAALRSAAGVEDFQGLPLVVAQVKRRAGQGVRAPLQRQASAGHVPGEVLDGKADAGKRLFQVAPVQQVDFEAPLVDPAVQIRPYRLVPADFGDEQRIVGGEDEIFPGPLQANPAVPPHRLPDFNGDVLRDFVFAEGLQSARDFVGREPRGGGVPERKRADAVVVDILGAFFQLGEAGQNVPCGFVPRSADLRENGHIALHDEWILGVV